MKEWFWNAAWTCMESQLQHTAMKFDVQYSTSIHDSAQTSFIDEAVGVLGRKNQQHLSNIDDGRCRTANGTCFHMAAAP
jgi:hypothetical protein